MTHKITFEGALGDKLAARIDEPDDPKAYALFAHCFSSNKDFSTVNRISKALNDNQIALFRFDFTGLGDSNGDFANTNFSSNVQDLISAANYMRDNFKAPDILIGHSFGGTAVIAAASQIPEAKAVATIGSPADTKHVQHNFGKAVELIKQNGEAEVTLSGRKFTIKKQFLDDIENQHMHKHITQLNRALLIMHSPIDETVSIDNAKVIYEAAKHPKSFISLDNADHLLMKNPNHSIYVAQVLAAWASQYVN